MSELITVIDGFDLVVALADGHVHPDDLQRARQDARATRERRGHPGGTLVIALLGGTGSGKSSLLNALAGERIAAVSPVRPHTNRPLAWVPPEAEPALGQLLDRLQLGDRAPNHRFPGLALLDLSGVDSIAPDHRAGVEALLPEIDAAIWVLDPVKYNDAVLHREFLARLADSADQFVFVLNQIDRVTEEEQEAVLADLAAILREDGIAQPVIFAVAADPPEGRPMGIESLAIHLRHRLDAKRVQLGKVLADARRSMRSLADAAGLRHGGTLDFEQRWAEVVEETLAELSRSTDPVTVERAVCRMEDFVGRLAAEAGGPFAIRLRHAFPDEAVEAAVRAAAARAPAVPAAGRKAGAPSAEAVTEELQQRLGAPLRRLVWERAALAASFAGLTVDALRAEASLQRGSPAPGAAGP